MKEVRSNVTRSSARIISSESRRAQCHAEQLIAAARKDAREIVDQARKEAAGIRARAEALAHRAVRIEAAGIIAAAEARRVRYESALAEDLVSVAIHAAEHLICREIKEDPSIVLRRIEAGLVLLRRERGLKLHVNPDVAGRFSRDIQSIARKRSLDSSIEIIADESMGPGDCVLVSPDVRIDMTLVEGLRIIHRHFLNREFTERS